MFFHKKRPHDPDGKETPRDVFMNRRRWLGVGLGASAGAIAAAAAYRWQFWNWGGSEEEVIGAGYLSPNSLAKFSPHYPAAKAAEFAYGRTETPRLDAAKYCNFYEFTNKKWVWRYVEPLQPYPWTITVEGLCRQPFTIDLDEFYRRYGDDLEERQYRHRCVERWAMAVPWTGLPLARLLLDADPLPEATFVRFVSFNRPDEASRQQDASYPWPYTEGLTIAEAMNDLALLTTGVYGEPLLKQHGAPLRMVIPWKYGYKSIKSIMRIELVRYEPSTFWTTLNPTAYPFQSNVNPLDVTPWRQDSEWMLGTREDFPTEYLNGYADQVGELYS
ncbi:protein-methionine-sulfoxide reductase catalytic subunit MsrP [Lignipirellula cremea]|uniref:Sulfoxide reductase catalytic subunit YedY n=1 Tax=Lignipirellula cremea TaxID=2528010 RepID=A0A518DW62_9BACT|nr:protein-methionine-sulfoxide reductase catalytic subunit MsrP [Lignipirellula cremea]QDU96077.1 Sulfoxide reductase catalytic subunit YedY precursor [Lignipirellula cremea]